MGPSASTSSYLVPTGDGYLGVVMPMRIFAAQSHVGRKTDPHDLDLDTQASVSLAPSATIISRRGVGARQAMTAPPLAKRCVCNAASGARHECVLAKIGKLSSGDDFT